MSRSAHEITTRCSAILRDEEIVFLVAKSSSPSAAFEMIFSATNDSSKAKAGRWLAILRRDYPEEYHKLIPVEPSHVNHDTAQTDKEMQS